MTESGKYQELVNLLSNSDTESSEPALIYCRDRAYLGFVKRSKAIKDFTKAISLDPTKSYYLQRGVILLENGQTSEATLNLAAALELNPWDLTALNQRAKAFLLADQTPKAMDDVNRALRLKPSNPQLYKLRADILRTTCDFQNAVGDYNRALGA